MTINPSLSRNIATDLIGTIVDVEPRKGWTYNGTESPRCRGVVRTVTSEFMIVIEERGPFGEPLKYPPMAPETYGLLHAIWPTGSHIRRIDDPTIFPEDQAQHAIDTLQFLDQLLDVIDKYAPKAPRSIAGIDAALAALLRRSDSEAGHDRTSKSCHWCGSPGVCDCDERIACPKAGQILHQSCGWCPTCKAPGFECTNFTHPRGRKP